MTTATAGMTTASESSAVFGAAIVTGVAYVALPIPRFVRMEVVKRTFTASRQRAMIAVARIVTVIYVAVKTVTTVEPGTGSDEDAACEPIRPVIAIGSAVIRGVVEVTVRTDRRNADTDRYLRRSFGAAG
jgi:hypothetical protein